MASLRNHWGAIKKPTTTTTTRADVSFVLDKPPAGRMVSYRLGYVYSKTYSQQIVRNSSGAIIQTVGPPTSDSGTLSWSSEKNRILVLGLKR